MRLGQALTMLFLAASQLFGATVHVPAQYPTIQSAIDAAVDGDRIDVAPGCYFESLSFLGKDIHLRSESGPLATTIHGSGAPVVQFVSGETSAAILEGFSLTGGDASFGAGVYVFQSGPTIRKNWIHGNPAPGTVTNGGGGVGLFEADGAIVEDNLIVDNVATSGGGVSMISSSVALRRNFVARNLARESGGGVSLATSSLVVEDCLISENNVSNPQFGGGALFAENSLLELHGSTIANNTVNGGFPSGVYVAFSSVADVQNCILWGNRPDFPAGTITEMQLFVSVSAMAAISHCNTEGGIVGSDSISDDPQFRPGPNMASPLFDGLANYYLAHVETGDAATSPCFDAGNPLTPLPIGSTRADSVPDVGNVDLGFHYTFEVFRRGDVNNDGTVNVTDAISTLFALFVPGSAALPCADSADANDDGFHDISDPLYLLSFLFVAGSPEIPEPTLACGIDPTVDGLSCMQSTCP